jgi:hypothetical protein
MIRFVLQNAQASTGVGTAASIRGIQALESKARDYVPVFIRTSAGASVSVQVEVSDDNTNWYAYGAAFTTVASSTVVLAPRSPYIRANVTANSGVTVNASLVA